MKTKLTLTATLAAGAALMIGCATQTNTEREFGNAVRMVTTNQVHDIGAARSPSRGAVTGGHPDRLEQVVDAHSGDVAESAPVQAPLSITVSGGSVGQ